MHRSARFIPLTVLVVFTIGAVGGGCASERIKSPQAATAPSSSSAKAIAGKNDPRRLSLDEIQPKLTLAAAASRPTSQPTTQRAPIESVELYAQAIDALKTGRRFTAINLLEKALKIDPDSFELNYTLGKAYVLGRADDEHSVAALERAAAIEPDHLELQTALGRQYLTRGDQAKGLEHLRLAVQTTAYAADENGAAEADLFLGRALQQNGYDRAALEQYARLLQRITDEQVSIRSDPRLAFLITDRLYVDIGDLYARNGQLEDALAAFEPAAKHDPANFDLEARVVNTLVGLKRYDDASRRAAEAVVRFRASPQSLDLLRTVHQASRRPGGAADALARMLKKRPNDTAVLFALVELLRNDGRWAQAEGYLADAANRTPNDSTILRRRITLRLQHDDVDGAARLLVETFSRRPDLGDELHDLWSDIVSPARTGHLRLAQVQALPVLPAQSAAKELGIAIVAGGLHRDPIAAAAIERAVKATPPFAPAFRERMAWIWQKVGDDAEQKRQSDQLITEASADPALKQEMTGVALLYRKQFKEAAAALNKAMEMGGKSQSLQLSYAEALRGSGDNAKFEQFMWKLVSDHPTFEAAYSTLYGYYAEASAPAQADRVLSTWFEAAPFSVSVRVLQAARQVGAGETDAAERIFTKLLNENPDDEDVLRGAYALYFRAGKVDALLPIVERHVREQPGNVAALNVLAEIKAGKGQGAEVVPAIDAARQTLADDPDQLYRLSGLYSRVGERNANESVLKQVLTIEPNHPPASNDLGFGWADRGENLAAAEGLIRQAVAAEPENPSFLDSLGWVLYKRGKFAEGRTSLEKAAGEDASQADPVVLDHLGDLLYRLGDKDAAGKQWAQAEAKLKDSAAGDRDDQKELKASLDKKTAQLKGGEPVSVSPVVEENPKQAKN